MKPGFIARRDTDRIEWRYDSKVYGYRMSKFWIDPYSKKERGLIDGIFAYATDGWLEKEIKRFSDAGWEIEIL